MAVIPVLQPPSGLLYPNVVTVWRFTETKNSAGKITGRSWSTTTGVACYLEAKPSQFELQGIVLAEGDNIFTLDIWSFPFGADLKPDDVLVCTTGAPKLLGGCWKIRGDMLPNVMLADKQRFIASRLSAPPAGVS